jgi:hypothetical protein
MMLHLYPAPQYVVLRSSGPEALTQPPCGRERGIYAESCIRTSENAYLPGTSVNRGAEVAGGSLASQTLTQVEPELIVTLSIS